MCLNSVKFIFIIFNIFLKQIYPKLDSIFEGEDKIIILDKIYQYVIRALVFNTFCEGLIKLKD